MKKDEANQVIEKLIKLNTSPEREQDFRKLFPFDLHSAKCQKKFDSMAASKTPVLTENGFKIEYMQKYAQLALLNTKDVSKLIVDAQRVRDSIKEDYCDPLVIILENKFQNHRLALRLIKRHCIVNDISWEIKKACDHSIYTKEKSPA